MFAKNDNPNATIRRSNGFVLNKTEISFPVVFSFVFLMEASIHTSCVFAPLAATQINKVETIPINAPKEAHPFCPPPNAFTIGSANTLMHKTAT